MIRPESRTVKSAGTCPLRPPPLRNRSTLEPLTAITDSVRQIDWKERDLTLITTALTARTALRLVDDEISNRFAGGRVNERGVVADNDFQDTSLAVEHMVPLAGDATAIAQWVRAWLRR
jgi:hypothetical protein